MITLKELRHECFIVVLVLSIFMLGCVFAVFARIDEAEIRIKNLISAQKEINYNNVANKSK